MYDPLFSQLEIAVLKSLGVTVLSENEVSLGEGEQEGCVTAEQRGPPGCAPWRHLLCISHHCACHRGPGSDPHCGLGGTHHKNTKWHKWHGLKPVIFAKFW